MTMMLTTYLASLSPLALLRSLPGACAQGLIWGLLALGVYITYKLLDFADLTVDGSMATGGAVAVMLIRLTMRPFFIVTEISLFMITYFFVFCKCLYARCGKILKFCLSGKDSNIFFKKTFTEILHILFFAIYLRRNHCSGGEYQKESGLFLSA